MTNRSALRTPEGAAADIDERIRLLERRLARLGVPGYSVPPGLVFAWALDVPPDGALVCDGSDVSRVTYAGLFASIGTTYGVGDGSTTFGLPDYSGRVLVGLDDTQIEFDTIGEESGEKTHTLTTAEMPAHNHPVRTADNNYRVASAGSTAAGGAGGDMRRNTTTPDELITTNTGGGGAHNNLQPGTVVLWCITTQPLGG